MQRILLLLACLIFWTHVVVAQAAQSTKPKADVTILLAFGTSDPDGQKSLQAIENAYKMRGIETMMVFSSNMIRRKLEKAGKPVYSIDAALDAAASKGYKNIEIQSLHVTPSEEYMKINRLIARAMERHPKRFDSVFFGHALLMSESDLTKTVDAVISGIPKERTAHDAVIFMGHGNNRGTGDIILKAVNDEMQRRDSRIWLANVEGALPFMRLLPKLKEQKIKKVWLLPFMIVAGDHAKNDMAGSEADSWKNILGKNGFAVEVLLQGMGHNAAIQNIFIQHTQESYDDILHGKILGSHAK